MVKTSLEVILDFMIKIEAILRTKKFGQIVHTNLFPSKFPTMSDFLLNENIRSEYYEQVVYLLNKLLTSYKNDNIKRIVIDHIDTFLLPKWQLYIKDLKKLYNDICKSETKFLDVAFGTDLINKLLEFHTRIFSYIARIVDLYFIRRFADKKYITNAITYTGAAHSVSFIYILHRIGFTISHCANCRLSINQLNKTVSDIKDFPTEKSLFELFDIFTEANIPQCTNVSDFPKDFQ